MNPYVDETTGTRFNKLGISDPHALHVVEYAVTDVRVAELRVKPIPGQFDLDHLKAIHGHIFQDLYEWAGRERTMNFSKRDPSNPAWTSPFAPASQIAAIGASVARELKSWDYLRGLKQDDFAAGMTTAYVMLNYMHPFPEGNGRSTTTMLSQLANEAGYSLKFQNVTREEWNHAAARSMPQRNVKEPTYFRKGDVAPIQDVFRRIVEPLREREKPQDRG